MNRLLPVLPLLVLLAACDGRKLDEVVFYEGPEFSLKVVRYYRHLFLHYNGEVCSVQCGSEHTRDRRRQVTQDEGWYEIGSGGAIGTQDAREVLDKIRNDYRIIDARTLLIATNGVSVSFDACRSFRGWYPTQLPAELIDPVEKPDHCAPEGTGDCRHYDFLGDRQPTYENIMVEPNGTVSFLTSSKSYKAVEKLRVSSTDFGNSWTVEKLHHP